MRTFSSYNSRFVIDTIGPGKTITSRTLEDGPTSRRLIITKSNQINKFKKFKQESLASATIDAGIPFYFYRNHFNYFAKTFRSWNWSKIKSIKEVLEKKT